MNHIQLFRIICQLLAPLLCLAIFVGVAATCLAEEPPVLRVGVVGLDTSHSPAYTKMLNDPQAAGDLAGCRVVAAYPHGSRDIESSASRIPQYTEEMKKMGVEITDSLEALLEKVDVVLLETNDGRLHWEQAREIIDAGKPLFIDKPLAASLADCIAIFDYAKQKNVPVFSCSGLRFSGEAQSLRAGKHGRVLGCDAHSPCEIEPTHPDLFWYGIHGVETLYAVMGPGCRSVQRAHAPAADVVVGTWHDGRVGTFRGMRNARIGYGGSAVTEKGKIAVGDFGGYRPLVVEIVKFFRGGKPPVSSDETIEIYTFMTAADESKAKQGAAVELAPILAAAKQEAEAKLKGLQ